MKFLANIKNKIKGKDFLSPLKAYNNWAQFYDEEKNNLMLHYDSIIFKKLLNEVEVKDKNILDYGCGTGRNVPEVLKWKPGKLFCADISENMLQKLKDKFPDIDTYLLEDYKIEFLKDSSTDIIISTLVIAHIEDIENLFAEWNRILKDNGTIILTDFHPELLQNGGERTFNFEGKNIRIKNYIHHLSEIESVSAKYGLKKTTLIEKKIDEKVKSFYEEANAIQVYNKFYGFPFIYGTCLKR